ncbi:polysaccharide biosynthesis tyrosine autokinase [Pleurocapsa sp. PCC 7319]|uniref:GumC family protein n=1 Tax=Pleurocapsa sp. PCC 7319 TaxID=118161 RepID=UPI00034D6604|nr:polysaccharide biosynthesis tyrosine autokinase [Pleurocapsa sp. PCC 7319]
MNQSFGEQRSYYLNDASAKDNSEGGLNLGEIKNIILRNFPLITGCTLVLTSLALLKISTTPPVYDASFEILSEALNIETSLTSTNYNELSTETREQITSVDLDEVQLKVLKSPKLILRTVESLKNQYSAINYQEMIGNLTIDIKEQSDQRNILLVMYKHHNKQQVSDVIDNLAQTYIDYSLEKRQSGIKRGIAFLDQQIPKVDLQVKEIENQISDLRSKYNFIEPKISIDQITNRLNILAQEREQNTIKRQELLLKLRNLEQELKPQSNNSTTAIELATPRYLELLNQLRNTDVEIGRKSAIFTNNSIEIQTLKQEKQQIAALIVKEREAIRQKLDNQIKILENRQRTITVEITNLQSRLEEWSTISRDYNHLQEKLTIANNKLNEFTLQKDALLVDAAQQEAPWQLLSPVTEPKINNISTINYLALSSTLGLLLGVGAALVLDSSQKIIYTSGKVEEITNLPVLGTIPYIPKSKDWSFIREARQLPPPEAKLQGLKQSSPKLVSPMSIEAFRSFAANLNLFNFNANPEVSSDTSLKSIVITSAIPREGKSTVALNLARACASLGKRILLVDTDLRSTDCLTKSFGLESEIGLSDILNQDNTNLGLEYIQQIPSEENLFILTSGFNALDTDSTKLDPSRLLVSGKMHHLMEEIKTHFDLVIYDLCAITGFADVNLLAAKTDGIIVVTGLGKIQSMALTEALNQLRLCPAPVLGVAVNQVVNKS